MTGCMHDLNTIAELHEVLRTKSKGDSEVERPLEGMEVALTINGMVHRNVDKSEEEDYWCRDENSVANFHKMVDALKRNEMPPTVDFIAARWSDPELQEKWLKAGNLIGSLTFERQKAHGFTAEEFIDDLKKTDQVLSPLMIKDSQRQRYFRYPRLKRALNPGDQSVVGAYLKKTGYAEVPATIDSLDSKFSELFCKASSRGDQACANLIKGYFTPLLLDSALRARMIANEIMGRDVKHIMMLEATQFTSDNLDEILKFCKRMGVKFITLDEALADPFYQRTTREGGSEAVDLLRRVQKRQTGESDE